MSPTQLSRMKTAGCESAVLELNSRALADRRASGIELDAAILTNIQNEQLDEHNSARAYQKINRLRSARKFGPWLLRIVRRQALWQRRKAQSRARHTVALVGEPAAGEAAEDGGEAMEMIGRLPEQECVVVSLRHLEEMSVAEIAAITGRPVGTVTKQLSRAYARLRGWLEEER